MIRIISVLTAFVFASAVYGQRTVYLPKRPAADVVISFVSTLGFDTDSVLFAIKADCHPPGTTLDALGLPTTLLVNTGGVGYGVDFVYSSSINRWRYIFTYPPEVPAALVMVLVSTVSSL